jgi:hypothetical protein
MAAFRPISHFESVNELLAAIQPDPMVDQNSTHRS